MKGNTSKRSLLLIDRGFEEMEALYPYYFLEEAGYTVEVVAKEEGCYEGRSGYRLEAKLTPQGVEIGKYSAIIIPGGLSSSLICTNPAMVTLVKDADSKKLVIGAVSDGKDVLFEAGVLDKQKAWAIESEPKPKACEGDQSVFVHGNLVFSRPPDDLRLFCKEVLGLLGYDWERPRLAS